MKKVILLFAILISFASCNEYQKALKSDDAAEKVKVAEKMYEQEKYKKAIRLYEEASPAYKGKPSAERMFYFYAKSLYEDEQYYLAGYQFKSFAASYPRSEKREEAEFLSAECYYRLSPVYSLDQGETDEAMTKLQAFIDNYPESEYLPKANEYVKELRTKLEKKAFEIAKQYYTISDYRYEYDVALTALDNFIIEYPGTPFKEEALLYKLGAAYKLALHSVPSKKEERLLTAKSHYASLIKYNGNTEFKKEADNILQNIEKELQQLSNTN